MIPDIRPATPEDADALWAILKPVFRAGDTYTVAPNISRKDALAYWCAPGNRVYLAGNGLGTYFLRRNQGGGGSHVCNCGYATAPAAQGKGVARAMLAHSLDAARAAGFRAMQYNFVVSSNNRAIALWQQAGFETVGHLPKAFDHPDLGFIDALVMYKELI